MWLQYHRSATPIVINVAKLVIDYMHRRQVPILLAFVGQVSPELRVDFESANIQTRILCEIASTCINARDV